MKSKFFLILVVFLSYNLSSKDYSDVKPFKATFGLEEGEMEVWMIKKEGNTWEMKSHVNGGRKFEREVVSVFKLNKDSIVPMEYRAKMRIIFIKIKSKVIFNWLDKKIEFEERDKKGSIDLHEGTLGPETTQVKMRLDLRNSNLESLPLRFEYKVYFNGEVKKRIYEIDGFENIQTPFGEYKTVKVKRKFPDGNKRQQVYWLAPELDFALVRILNKDRRKDDIRLENFEFLH